MIYKFIEHETGMFMEIEQFNESNQSIELPDTICFSIGEDGANIYHIHLLKDDIYKLIGALHLLHKEMK